MLTPEMGGVTIQYSTDPSISVQNAVKVEGQEDGSKGINWVTYANGGIIPEGVTAIRFKTNQPILTNQSGLASIGIKAPTINSETNFTNKLWARTEQYGADAGSFEVFRSVPVVTIQGLNSSSLRGKVYLDKNANGVFDDGELGVTSTVVKIECTLGACLTAPQGAIFSMMVDSNGVYAFSRDATNIFASADGSGTAIANFQGVISGTWTITETPPTNPATAISSTSIGTINGIASGEANGRSITGVKIGSDEVGVDYDFAERLLDGAIEVTNALTLPARVTGPFDFTFTATCDLPVPNTQKSATLSYPSNTKVSITGIGGVQSIIATNVLSPTVKIEKSVTSPPTVVAGNPTQFDTTYRLTVSNTGESAQVYDLKDQFKFDSDVSLVGVPAIVKSANVSSVVNSAFTGSSTNTSIITGESIEAGTLTTPNLETYDVTVRLTVPAGSDVSNNFCTDSAGQGLFNVATLSVEGASDLTAMACSDTPTVLATNLVLQKAWVDATVGENVAIPATKDFSANTTAFNAAAEKPSSITSSDTVVLAVGDVGVLPLEIFTVPANAINYNASAWSCFDGTTPAVEIPQGGRLTIAAANAGKTLTCTLTNTSVVAGVNVTKTVAVGPTPVAGFGNQFDVTYRISVSNTNPSATVYDLSDSLGFDADATVVGTPVITKSTNVGGVINADFTGTGANTALVSTESIEAGSINIPTEETYEIAVRVKVPEIGNINNQLCTNASGSGLFNKAQMTVAGAVKEATACVPTPAAKTSQLTLKVNWLNALVGETITIPGTTGLSNNTKAFDAVSSGSNAVTSDTTIALLNDSVTLPTPSFAIVGNELFYGSPIAWVCTDEVNPIVNVAFGGSLTFDDKYDGRSVVCQVTYISVVADLTIDSEMITVGKEPIAGTEDEFNLIYRISVKNNNSSATVVYSLRGRFAFDPNVSVVGMPVITKSDNVSEPIKAGFTGVGADTVLIDNENIAANSTETFDVAIRYKVLNLNSTETNACTNEEGFGLFHQSTLDIGSVSKTVNDCAATRMLKKIPVELAVE